MNPYDSPQPSSADSQTSGNLGKPRSPWLVVPAVVSWCFSGLALLALPVGIYRATEFLPVSTGAGEFEQLMAFASVALIAALLVAGIINILAGFRWYQGRWIWALIFNVIATGTFLIPVLAFDAVAFAALEVPEWPVPNL